MEFTMKRVSNLLVLGAFAFTSFAFYSCANDDLNEKSSTENVEVETVASQYVVGSTVTYEDIAYKVIRNDFISAGSRASEVFADGSYRASLLSEKLGIEKCIELFDLTTRKETSAKGLASLTDKYVELDSEGNTIATAKQEWSQSGLFPSLTTSEKNAAFNALSEEELREYDPDKIYIEAKKSLYGNDLSKHYNYEFDYDRNDDKSVNLDALKCVKTWKDYALNFSGKEKSVWRTEEYAKGSITYCLQNPGNESSSGFASVKEYTNSENYTYKYDLQAAGDGKINGSTSTSDFDGIARITSLSTDAISLKFTSKVNDVLTVRYDITNSESGSIDSLKIRERVYDTDGTTTTSDKTESYSLTDFDFKYVAFSDTKKTIGEKEYPAAITITAPVLDEETSILHTKYLVLTFNLSDSGEYEPDIESYIQNYKNDFSSIEE